MDNSPAVEAAARGLIDGIDRAAQAGGMQTGYVYPNDTHTGQRVGSDGSKKGEERKEWLREMRRRFEPEGVFQDGVRVGF